MQTRNLRELVLSSLFVALIAIGAIIRIPLGSTVYTLQFLATLLAGALLGGRLGALAVLTYTVMGLVGLPVFASGGGPSYILQPTFGYLVAFMLQAYVGGTYIRRSGPITFKKQLTAHLIGLVIVYTVGIAYFYAVSRYLLQSTMTFGVMLWYCAVLQIVPTLSFVPWPPLLGSGPTGSVFGSSKKGKERRKNMGRGLFVTGTGTDVGKTFVTALMVKKLREHGYDGSYYKAALSGAETGKDGGLIPGDAQFVKMAAGLSEAAGDLVTYIYKEAVSPHLASRWNKDSIDLTRIQEDYARHLARHDYLTMEGSGGIICPLSWESEKRLLLEDVILALKLPCVIVADAGLGTINASVLTARYLKERGIRAKGFFFNHWDETDPMQQDNWAMTEALTGLPILAGIKDGDRDLSLSADRLAALYE